MVDRTLPAATRYAIMSLVVFFVVGLVLMPLVPVRRAIRAVGNDEPAAL